tara:strand:+ start:5040 stop:5579 length:540 start_codon:yes stop_codon:yes gene_type:complete
MLVDKSHSKKDIVYLFKKHGVIIDDKLSKGNIVKNIDTYIKDFKFNVKIKNETELKDYLKNTSPKQRPNTSQKNDIMFKAKKIIKWAKNDYIFNGATYTDDEEPYQDIMSIYMWGDLPSVRRACRMYNNSIYCKNHINPVITAEIEEELNNNKFIKSQVIHNLQVRRTSKEDPILIVFD